VSSSSSNNSSDLGSRMRAAVQHRDAAVQACVPWASHECGTASAAAHLRAVGDKEEALQHAQQAVQCGEELMHEKRTLVAKVATLQALGEAVNDLVASESPDPLRHMSTFLAEHAQLHGELNISWLRRFLREVDAVAQAARQSLETLQEEAGHKTSRTGYLKVLSEIIGPDPRPSDWNAGRSWHDSWRADWRRMYLEHTGMSTEPDESGWQAIEEEQAAKLAGSIHNHLDEENWSFGAAEAYTWLSSIEARSPMARALREGSPEFAAATYALCSSLTGRSASPPSHGQPSAYRNLYGRGGLVESDPNWERLETPDRYGFRGLTSTALVRAMHKARYFDERGFLVQVGKGLNEFVPSDVVGFVNAAKDEHGFHAGLVVASSSIAFPPNTLFRLKKIVPPGEWVAPSGHRPQQRLLVVTCTFRLPDTNVVDGGTSKVCEVPTTLMYGAREMYVRGLSDVLDKPLLSLEDEWTRPRVKWTDRTGRQYTLREEWDYVRSRVPAQAAVGSGMGVRDERNAGRTPEDFLRLVNEHVERQRAAHDACRGLPADAALLTLEEVLAVRLYSGPGYQPLNAYLRQLGRLSGVVRESVATHPGLTFTATAALLCSAIRKLAAVTPPDELTQPLYRAVRGELPRTFWVEDKQGMVCAVDAGFMSTSKNRDTPIHYMGRALNVLWELCPSGESDMAYHRGASIEMLSQYAGEEEVLFPPCSMLVVMKEDVHRAASSKEPERVTAGDGEAVEFVAIRVRPFFV
jgi:hypothetical protein